MGRKLLRIGAVLAGLAGFLAPVVLGRRGVAVGAVLHGLVLYPTLRRNCGWFGRVVRKFATEGREVWLTIDDGPTERDTVAMLEVLGRFEAKATFFLVGRRAEAMRAVAWRVRREGHGVGNHSSTHPAATFWALGPGVVEREIREGAEAIRCATGEWPRLFRAPVGMVNPFVHGAVEAVGGVVVGWSASGVDGLGDRGERVVGRILRQLEPGAILVLHEGGAPGRVETLTLLLEELKARGYRCVVPGMEAMR